MMPKSEKTLPMEGSSSEIESSDFQEKSLKKHGCYKYKRSLNKQSKVLKSSSSRDSIFSDKNVSVEKKEISKDDLSESNSWVTAPASEENVMFMLHALEAKLELKDDSSVNSAKYLYPSIKSDSLDSIKKVRKRVKGTCKPAAKDKIKEKMVPRKSDKVLQDLKEKDREQRKSLVLWRRPLRTLQYFLLECKHQLWQGFQKLLSSKWIMGLMIFATALYFVSISVRGEHTEYIQRWTSNLNWWGMWIVLGIMSSAGFGTGLHTFLLYLGPHIAKVTLAAYECKSVEFPEPPYPDEIVCPKTASTVLMTIWIIVKKVRVEAFMWGAGTAIGELPPYYLARSAMLTGVDPDDEEYEEAAQKIEEMANNDGGDTSMYTRVMKVMKQLVEKAGFFGILIAASIPNPLFDLAGITCGHFLVPFWTFFGATLIGKAIIKMHIQMLFVVVLFSQEYVDMIINWIGYLPYFGTSLQRPFTEFLAKQKKNLHHEPGTLEIKEGENIIKRLFDLLVSLMIVFFILSIVNSMAQNYMAREQKVVREKKMDRRR